MNRRLADPGVMQCKESGLNMETSSKTLFINAKLLLNGFTDLQKSFEVLVQGHQILSVSETPLDREGAAVIDADGLTLMPGLIDAHAHITGLSLSPRNISYPVAEIVNAASSY